jgi:hypothetical protein
MQSRYRSPATRGPSTAPAGMAESAQAPSRGPTCGSCKKTRSHRDRGGTNWPPVVAGSHARPGALGDPLAAESEDRGVTPGRCPGRERRGARTPALQAEEIGLEHRAPQSMERSG